MSLAFSTTMSGVYSAVAGVVVRKLYEAGESGPMCAGSVVKDGRSLRRKGLVNK
jgi:hypothetical protein